MNDYNKTDDDFQTDSDDLEIIIPNKSMFKIDGKLPKKFSHPVLTFDNPSDEKTANEREIIASDTLFSPKDKVSNVTWANKLPIGHDIGVTTSRRKGTFGCVVHLDYEKIINNPDVITGAVLSPFDRCVYDAVVTLHVAGNSIFSTLDIWRIISNNPKAQITPITRQKIIRSMFHISRFWISIATDDSNKFNTWCNLRYDKPYESERKLYKNLQATYTGRLLDFRVLGNITFDVTYFDSEQTFTEKKSFPEIWKLGFPPILYQYAKAKGQISATPIQLISTAKSNDTTITVRRGSRTDELTVFLAREIDTMKKTAQRKQPYSRFILLERIYHIDGINDIEQTENNIKVKKKTTRDKLQKILQRLKENGFIKNYALHKKVHNKSLTFHSIEILF